MGQTLHGVTVFLLFDTLGNGAYQVAVLTLLVTMVIGFALIRPVSDRWAGSAEQPGRAGAPNGEGAAHGEGAANGEGAAAS